MRASLRRFLGISLPLALSSAILFAGSAQAATVAYRFCPTTAGGGPLPSPQNWTATATPATGATQSGALDASGCIGFGLTDAGSAWSFTVSQGSDTLNYPILQVTSTGVIVPAAGTTSGSAGGALSGSYPNPGLAASQSRAITWTGAQTFSPGSGATTITTGGLSVQNGGGTILGTNSSCLLAGGGATNPQFNVDCSAGSVATGLNVKGAAAGAAVAVSAISSGANETMTLDAKGTGTLKLQSVATGGINAGAPTGGDCGAGCINAQALKVNNAPVATNAAALTAHGVVGGAGSSALTITSAGTAGQVLTSNGPAADPTFQATAASNPTLFQGTVVGAGLSNATNNLTVAGVSFAGASRAANPLAEAVTLTKLAAREITAPGGTDSYIYTLMKNGSATAVTCTISGVATTCTDTAHSATYAAGDTIGFQIVGSATAAHPDTAQWGLGT